MPAKTSSSRTGRRAAARRTTASARLRRYHDKRNLRASGEPAGGSSSPRAKAARFVIQKHDATRLHYDFRLEMEGVLRSWAVPKGLPTRAGERALAIEVEDHPIAYGKFEGVIPEGNYGAGPVMLWDRGHYSVVGDDPVSAYRAGKIHLELEGEKCRGQWTLVRFKGTTAGVKSNWLVLKNRDKTARNIRAAARDKSVLTGRTMNQILSGGSRATRTRRQA